MEYTANVNNIVSRERIDYIFYYTAAERSSRCAGCITTTHEFSCHGMMISMHRAQYAAILRYVFVLGTIPVTSALSLSLQLQPFYFLDPAIKLKITPLHGIRLVRLDQKCFLDTLVHDCRILEQNDR